MPELPPPRRERLSSRLAELVRVALNADTPEKRKELATELNRLAVGG